MPNPMLKTRKARIVFLVGGIASGKSSVAAQLERLGAIRIDLDQISREVLVPGSILLKDIAKEFGADLIQADGSLDRHKLALRAFATAEHTEALEALELPAIKKKLVEQIKRIQSAPIQAPCIVVEVPLPNKMGPLLELADEVLGVICPRELRRIRAIGRGMSEQDFDRRAARQLSDADLLVLCDTTLDNSGDQESLKEQLQKWWNERFV
ncbi:dephospho-CoA kinase [uncultured Olegusella sp.]|uniref:dephospho-CoA kinase n=1 Tax=uncultured Olegusella sp. TaxID=1979846 RepID=UPI0026320135|nr:dephospho-CoA kinase [uncultured Olegusella sp.]